jgi:hypothetical protein
MSKSYINDDYTLSLNKHFSFSLRKNWLYKGTMYIKENDNPVFSGVEACDELGIGKEMVKSLYYWLQATQMIVCKKGKPSLTSYANIILENDPYFIEIGTMYFIHYLLASNQQLATSWWWFFNKHKGHSIYKEQFINDMSEYLAVYLKEGKQYSNDVLETDFNTLIKTYYANDIIDNDPEDTKICPLAELGLIKKRHKGIYDKTSPARDDINIYILFGIICNNLKEGSDEIPINDVLFGDNNIGKIFNLERQTVFYLLEEMQSKGLIKITRTAGLDVFRLPKRLSLEDSLKAYYDDLYKRGRHE